MQTFEVSSFISSPEARRQLKRGGNIKHVICHKRGRIIFLLTEDKTLVMLSSGTFLLEPVEIPGDLWRRRLNRIRMLILKRRITTYEELLEIARPGVIMTYVRLDWYI